MKYVSASLTLEMNGRPLKNVKVRINNSLLTHRGNGSYGGAIPSTYHIRLGKKLVYSVEFPKPLIRASHVPPCKGKIILGTYKISNIVRWVWPRPGQTIYMSRILTCLFKWDFTGRPAPTEFFIKDRATNTRIFSKTLSAEQQKVSARLLKPGKEFVMGIWASSPIGKFRLSRHCKAGSKIDWYFSNTMTFNTGRRLKPFIRK